MEDDIQKLAAAITKQVHPTITGQDMTLVIPAFIQVTLNMVMFGMDCDAHQAAEMIIGTLQDAKVSGMN